jgi:TM2 domain-containing membrane protein YozV
MSGTCPYCRAEFEANDEAVPCAGCGTFHHADCLAENGGCTVFGCSNAPVEEAKISVSDLDLTASARPLPPQAPSSPSVLNLQTPSVPAAPTVTPPPPLPHGVTPPPPPPRISGGGYPPYPPAYPTFGGYMPAPANPYMPRKSRVVFVLLAVFLGPFGGHNFYAGYTTKAIIQLCLTVLTCFIGSVVSWIWAIVEACVINQDNDGIEFV